MFREPKQYTSKLQTNIKLGCASLLTKQRNDVVYNTRMIALSPPLNSTTLWQCLLLVRTQLNKIQINSWQLLKSPDKSNIRGSWHWSVFSKAQYLQKGNHIPPPCSQDKAWCNNETPEQTFRRHKRYHSTQGPNKKWNRTTSRVMKSVRQQKQKTEIQKVSWSKAEKKSSKDMRPVTAVVRVWES